MQDTTKGCLLGAAAAATYGMNPLFALPLYAAGMNADSVLFFRYLLAIPLVGLMLRLRGRSLGIRRAEALPLLAAGVLMAVSSLALFESYNFMDAGIASTLLFVYPVLVALIMAAGFGERLGAVTVAGMAGALGGVALLCQGGGGRPFSLVGAGLVFASALSYALYIVGANRSRLKEMATLKVTLYVLVGGLVVFGARFASGVELIVPPAARWYLWANCLALAVFPTAVSFLCTTAAVRYIGSTATAVLGALEPVTALFFGMAVFGERLSAAQALGVVLIIAAVTAVVAGGRVAVLLVRLRRLFPRLPRPRLLRRR